MQASTLLDTAESVGEKVTELAQDVSDVALRLAAKTPWVDAPKPSRRIPMWLVLLAAVGAVAMIGWLLASRRKPTGYIGDETTERARDTRGRFAAAGS